MRLTLVFAALLSFTTAAHGQNYPTHAVRMLVGFAPGGSTDITARVFAQELTKLWNMQVIVDNRPGASGRRGLVSRRPVCGKRRMSHR